MSIQFALEDATATRLMVMRQLSSSLQTI